MDEVTKLKDRATADIVVHGSAQPAEELPEHESGREHCSRGRPVCGMAWRWPHYWTPWVGLVTGPSVSDRTARRRAMNTPSAMMIGDAAAIAPSGKPLPPYSSAFEMETPELSAWAERIVTGSHPWFAPSLPIPTTL